MRTAMLNCLFNAWFTFDHLREIPLSEPKQDDSFKVVDRRLFTPDGELRKEVAEQQDREHETPPAAAAKPNAANSAPRGPAGRGPRGTGCGFAESFSRV